MSYMDDDDPNRRQQMVDDLLGPSWDEPEFIPYHTTRCLDQLGAVISAHEGVIEKLPEGHALKMIAEIVSKWASSVGR